MPTADRTVTHALAERHEALWLSLAALQKDVAALAAKKPHSLVSEPVRIVAEGLLSDCAPFVRHKKEKLPMAAPDLAGLAVQLGQALAGLDAFESRHTRWDARWNCRVWSVAGDPLPVRRLRPAVAPPPPPATFKGESMRDKLAKLIDRRHQQAYENGFRAGRAARLGAPEATALGDGQTYPPLT